MSVIEDYKKRIDYDMWADIQRFPKTTMRIVMSDILDELRRGVCRVVFTKKDGTERTMNCTLMKDSIPEDKVPTGGIKQLSEDVFRVFDVDINEWRSFRKDSVISFES